MNIEKMRAIYGQWVETESVIDSCLSGIMGQLFADNAENPKSVGALLGDFCFLAGMGNAHIVEEAAKLHGPGYLIFAAQDPTWLPVLENCLEGRLERGIRYAIAKDDSGFDRDKLRHMADALPDGYQLRWIDETLFARCKALPWCESLTCQYASWEDFERLGMGVVAMRNDEITAGASSYSTYSRGIEVEVDTHEAHRRRGLATACAAGLILACLDRGLFPSWDAANPESVGLAQKLGYRFSHEYPVWTIEL